VRCVEWREIMVEINVVEEGILDTDPKRAFMTLLDELQGHTHWWMPHWEAQRRGSIPISEVGGIVDITVHRIGTPRFSGRVTHIEPNRLIKVDFFEGDLRGDGEWLFEPANGKTIVRFRFHVRPHRLLYRFLSHFVNIGAIHSGVVQAGFKGWNRYLEEYNITSEVTLRAL
jgi:hypothetical protein